MRLVAATHQNLEQLIRQGKFREDLFYRLNVITLSVPPLRDRPEDVPELTQHFLKIYAARAGKEIAQIDDEALLALREYQWPGNVRELENAVERAVVVADGSILAVDDLPAEVTQGAAAAGPSSHLDTPSGSADWGMRRNGNRATAGSAMRLLRAVAAADGNKAEAARASAWPGARSSAVSRNTACFNAANGKPDQSLRERYAHQLVIVADVNGLVRICRLRPDNFAVGHDVIRFDDLRAIDFRVAARLQLRDDEFPGFVEQEAAVALRREKGIVPAVGFRQLGLVALAVLEGFGDAQSGPCTLARLRLETSQFAVAVHA